MNIRNENVQALALTIRPEHRLVIINQAIVASIRISSKAVFIAMVLSVLNMVI